MKPPIPRTTKPLPGIKPTAPVIPKAVLDYQKTITDLNTFKRDPVKRVSLLAQEKKLAVLIAKNPELLEKARSLGMEKQIKTSAARAAKPEKKFSIARGQGMK